MGVIGNVAERLGIEARRIDVHAVAGAEDVGEQEADDERDRGHHLEIDQRLDADAADLLEVAGAGNAVHHHAEHDRRHDHRDQLEEGIARGFSAKSRSPARPCRARCRGSAPPAPGQTARNKAVLAARPPWWSWSSSNAPPHGDALVAFCRATTMPVLAGCSRRHRRPYLPGFAELRRILPIPHLEDFQARQLRHTIMIRVLVATCGGYHGICGIPGAGLFAQQGLEQGKEPDQERAEAV